MSLNDFVVDALVHTPSYQNARLWTVENHEKYSTLDQPELHSEGGNRFNHEIFLLMRALNEQGVGEEGLCADARGQGALKSVIGNVAERLAAAYLRPFPIGWACVGLCTDRLLGTLHARASSRSPSRICIREGCEHAE